MKFGAIILGLVYALIGSGFIAFSTDKSVDFGLRAFSAVIGGVIVLTSVGAVISLVAKLDNAVAICVAIASVATGPFGLAFGLVAFRAMERESRRNFDN